MSQLNFEPELERESQTGAIYLT